MSFASIYELVKRRNNAHQQKLSKHIPWTIAIHAWALEPNSSFGDNVHSSKSTRLLAKPAYLTPERSVPSVIQGKCWPNRPSKITSMKSLNGRFPLLNYSIFAAIERELRSTSVFQNLPDLLLSPNWNDEKAVCCFISIPCLFTSNLTRLQYGYF